MMTCNNNYNFPIDCLEAPIGISITAPIICYRVTKLVFDEHMNFLGTLKQIEDSSGMKRMIVKIY